MSKNKRYFDGDYQLKLSELADKLIAFGEKHKDLITKWYSMTLEEQLQYHPYPYDLDYYDIVLLLKDKS